MTARHEPVENPSLRRTSLSVNRLDKSDNQINARLPASTTCPCRRQVAWDQVAKFSPELFARGFVNSTHEIADDLFLEAQCCSFWITNSSDLLSIEEYQTIGDALLPGAATGQFNPHGIGSNLAPDPLAPNTKGDVKPVPTTVHFRTVRRKRRTLL